MNSGEIEARYRMNEAAHEIYCALIRFETHREEIGYLMEMPLRVRTNGLASDHVTPEGKHVLNTEGFFNDVRFIKYIEQSEPGVRDKTKVVELWPAVITSVEYAPFTDLVLDFVNSVCLHLIQEQPFSLAEGLIYFRGNYVHSTTRVSLITSPYYSSVGQPWDAVDKDMTHLRPIYEPLSERIPRR